MKIWVDADACPQVVKAILFRAADKRRIQTTLVANRPMKIPASLYIDSMVVAQGFDVADDEIVKRIQAGDLVVTADIPLAAQVIERGAHALDPRGELYDTESI
ncbi:DUF188 domain-containing protein, partial [Myxococcota bacterium]|nr:DUF188 domain-containing protein [Myxococcota bacterium]